MGQEDSRLDEESVKVGRPRAAIYGRSTGAFYARITSPISRDQTLIRVSLLPKSGQIHSSWTDFRGLPVHVQCDRGQDANVDV